MDPLVSIIIPIYNVEQFLPACLDSVQSQEYKNIEIICINDGSPDLSRQIAESYARTDPRFVLINKANGGLSDARNVGINVSTGDYLFFLDSDDCIAASCIKTLVDITKKENVQIASCEIAAFSNDSFQAKEGTKEKCIIGDSYLVYKESYSSNSLRVSLNIACAKLFSKTLFEDCKFPVGKVNEDECLTYKLYANAKRACHIFSALYGYRQRSESITHTNYSIRSKLHLLDAYEDRVETFLIKNDSELNCFTVEDYLCQISSFYYYLRKTDLNEQLKTRYSRAFKKYKKYLFPINKIKRYVFLFSPKLYCTLVNLLQN